MSMPKIIMIVDDDADNIDFFCDALSEIDPSIHCIGIKGGEEAIDFLKSNSSNLPDYIFLDINMPRMDGKQCLQCFKSDADLSSIPVIMYTTSKSKDDVDFTMKLGAVYFLTKPSKFSELKEAIRYILDERLDNIT